MADRNAARRQQYVPRPVPVTAVQFTGWANAAELASWAQPALFVPRGYEHHMRRTSELDRSNGDVLPDAPEYLVLLTAGETPPQGAGQTRVDLFEYVVRDGDGHLSVWRPGDFADHFVTPDRTDPKEKTRG